MKSPKPYSIGRTVVYVPKNEDQPKEYQKGNRAEALPAVIVRTWENFGYENDEINSRVFTDGPIDLWRTSVPYDENKMPGTWHWPEIK